MGREACPSPDPDCKYYGTRECMVTTHHLLWPRRNYQTRTERQFRELPENKERLSRCDHDEVHATEPIPDKPPLEEMLRAIGESALREAS